MRVGSECIPCTFRQVLNVARTVTESRDAHLKALVSASHHLPLAELDRAPAELLPLFLSDVYDILGTRDPYLNKKRQINAEILALFPKFKEQVKKADDPLYTSLLYAVAGNIIDLGIIPEYDLFESINQVFALEFAVNDYDLFRDRLSQARKIVYLGDNAGEIVFDKLAVSEILNYAPVTYLVKGSPILNDATLDDAEQVGMDQVARVLVNGSGYPGTVLRDISDEALEELRTADLIISKGQANYETLNEFAAPVFFLLKAKCEYVASDLGVKFGDVLLKASNHFTAKARI